MASPDRQADTRWNLAAALAGWLFPGLGHFLLGQRRRGLILAMSICAMWLSGLALGGVSVIDRHTHPAWFTGQMLMSPSVLVNMYRQHLQNNEVNGKLLPGTSPYEPSFSHIHEEGTLCTALAGLLNLLAILDVIYRDPSDPRYRPDALPASEGGGVGGGVAGGRA